MLADTWAAVAGREPAARKDTGSDTHASHLPSNKTRPAQSREHEGWGFDRREAGFVVRAQQGLGPSTAGASEKRGEGKEIKQQAQRPERLARDASKTPTHRRAASTSPGSARRASVESGNPKCRHRGKNALSSAGRGDAPVLLPPPL